MIELDRYIKKTIHVQPLHIRNKEMHVAWTKEYYETHPGKMDFSHAA